MGFLILIAGLPATGKTSFARYLRDKMKIPMISKDIVKEHLFDTIGFKSREEKVALGTAAMDLMYHFADALLETGGSAILENNFENASKPGLLKLIDKHRCRFISVRFIADTATLTERFLARDRSPDRHRGHVINTRYPEPEGAEVPSAEAQKVEFADYYDTMKKRGMEDFSIGGDEIVADSSDFSKISYEEIYRELKAKLNLK